MARFGDYGIATGRWRIIGEVEGWDRERWPLPLFVRGREDPNVKVLVRYNDKLEVVSEQEVVAHLVPPGLPEDAQFGSAVIEKMLAARIA